MLNDYNRWAVYLYVSSPFRDALISIYSSAIHLQHTHLFIRVSPCSCDHGQVIGTLPSHNKMASTMWLLYHAMPARRAVLHAEPTPSTPLRRELPLNRERRKGGMLWWKWCFIVAIFCDVICTYDSESAKFKAHQMPFAVNLPNFVLPIFPTIQHVGNGFLITAVAGQYKAWVTYLLNCMGQFI